MSLDSSKCRKLLSQSLQLPWPGYHFGNFLGAHTGLRPRETQNFRNHFLLSFMASRENWSLEAGDFS
jgi:uncharacterized protein YfiM (DUF2279 family)